MAEKILPTEDYEVPAVLSEEIVVFPQTEVAISVREERSIAAIGQALKEHQLLAFIPSSNRSIEGMIGTLAHLVKGIPSKEGPQQILLRGLWRIRVKSLLTEEPYVKIRFERVNESEDSQDGSSLVKRVYEQIDEFVKLIPGIPSEIINLVKSAENPGKLADLCALSPNFTNEERLDLLRTLDPEKRLEKVNELFEKQLDALKRITEVKPIPECETCIDLADKAFEADPIRKGEIVLSFLNHVMQEHTGELLALLAEKYGPIFMKKRALR